MCLIEPQMQYVYVDIRKNWLDARDYCRTLSEGDLVSIHSTEEEAAVRAVGSPYGQTYWIGINDLARDGVPNWSDGTLFNEEVTKWGTMHPQSGECGVFDVDNNFWWDLPCTARKQPFICQVGVFVVAPTSLDCMGACVCCLDW